MLYTRSIKTVCWVILVIGFLQNLNAQITIQSGAELSVLEGETLTAEGDITNTGTISGKGTINVAGDFLNTGTFAISIGPDETTHTTLEVGGIFTADGNFTVTNDSYTPSNGDEATIITSGDFVTGSFTNADHNNWLANYDIPGIGDFTLSYLSILPTELINFSGRHSKGQIILNWETASEINNKGFEIQRSLDGESWQYIGFKDGFGNSDQKQDYVFIDEGPHPGINYYRLKQIDLDERCDYSSIISVDNTVDQTILIFPNPNNGVFEVKGMDGGFYKILDTCGHLIQEGELINTTINISKYSEGIYIILFISGSKISSQKFTLFK